MSMPLNNYPKPALSCQDQVHLLKERGLIVEDETFAVQTLQHISYYRLRGYYIQWYDKTSEKFTEQRTFRDIVRLHEFDTRLSTLLLEVLSVIEINFRTYLAHDMSMDSHWSATPHLDLSNYKSALSGSQMLGVIAKAILDSKDREVFIKHHLEHYNGVVPIWAVVEILSLGQLSRLFSNLSPKIKRTIAYSRYGQTKFDFVENWLYIATNYRNVCAHRSRLYNRLFTGSKLLASRTDQIKEYQRPTLYAGLIALKHLSCNNHFCFNWFDKLKQLIAECSDVVEIDKMGFPPFWQDHLKSS